MPFDIEKRKNKYLVISEGSGRVLGTHTTKKSALRQLRAIYANYKGDTNATTVRRKKTTRKTSKKNK